jgi:glycosyltransferase involved in cell wall biosynthesis
MPAGRFCHFGDIVLALSRRHATVLPLRAVAIEAQMAGTPAITTDWGAFTETVEHGVTGFRCRTLDHLVWPAKNVGRLWPYVVHQRAASRNSMDAVKYKYEEYFAMLTDLLEGRLVHSQREL